MLRFFVVFPANAFFFSIAFVVAAFPFSLFPIANFKLLKPTPSPTQNGNASYCCSRIIYHHLLLHIESSSFSFLQEFFSSVVYSDIGDCNVCHSLAVRLHIEHSDNFARGGRWLLDSCQWMHVCVGLKFID